MLSIWHEKADIRFKDVDRSDRLTLASVFSFFQEAAISHAAHLGVGRDAMAKAGHAWILSRFSLFVQRRPRYEETVQVSTWPRNWEKLFILRDYEIRDADDIPVVRGRGSWIVLDIEKRRPLRAQALMGMLPLNEGINAFSASPVSLSPLENLTKTNERTAVYSDIDYIGHVNNARYIQWIQDVTNADVLTNANQIRLDINYLSEVLPGETVELWSGNIETTDVPSESAADYPQTLESGFAYEGRRSGNGGQAVFRAELRIGK